MLTLKWLKVVLEIRDSGVWIPIGISRSFAYSTIQDAINVLPAFAERNKIGIDNVRVKRLRTWGDVFAARKRIDQTPACLICLLDYFCGEQEGEEWKDA